MLVLSGCQATPQTIGTTMIAVTGLAGFALAEDKAFATVPLTCYVLGSAITTIPASLLMSVIGRRDGFQFGTALGMLGAAICATAMYAGSFWLLCAGMTALGMYTAFGKYYRFAAADAADVDFRAKAISLTLAGGIVGGIFGPEMAKRTTTLFADRTYLGSYLSLIFVCLVATLILARLDIPKLSEHERKDSGRPLPVIMRQPVFIVAALASMLSYGIMNLFMTSTPLAMRARDHPFADAALILQWHMIGMYGPSFFTGSLFQRYGVLNVIFAGIVLLFACIVSALAGTHFVNFWAALFRLGLGWNFTYVGGSALLNQSGWHAVNYGSIPFLLLAAAATLWLMWQRRAVRQPAVQTAPE